MPSANVAGVGDINVVRTGPRAGVPVVFLHPAGLDLTWWGDQFEAFSGERDVIAFDLPGHGRSGPLDGTPTFDLMADVLEKVLVTAGGRPVHVVGVSIGGMIAQTFALRRPDLVQSLSLVATLCDFPGPARDALRERARVAREEGMGRIAELSNERWFPAAFRNRRPDVLDRATTSLVRQDASFHAALWEMISGLDLADRLPAIRCPTMIVAGAEDVNAQVSMGEKMASLIPEATLTVLPGVGHFPMIEAPQAFNELLRAFLATADRVPLVETA